MEEVFRYPPWINIWTLVAYQLARHIWQWVVNSFDNLAVLLPLPIHAPLLSPQTIFICCKYQNCFLKCKPKSCQPLQASPMGPLSHSALLWTLRLSWTQTFLSKYTAEDPPYDNCHPFLHSKYSSIPPNHTYWQFKIQGYVIYLTDTTTRSLFSS